MMARRARLLFWLGALFLAASACGVEPEPAESTETTAEAIASEGGHHGAGSRLHAIHVGAMQSVVEDTDDGVSLTLTADPADLSALRERIRGLAELINRHAERSSGEGHDSEPHQCGHAGSDERPAQCDCGAGHDHHASAQDDGTDALHGHHPRHRLPGQLIRLGTRARAEDVDGGVKLLLAPTDPTNLGALREQMRTHVERFQTRERPVHDCGAHENAGECGPSFSCDHGAEHP